MTRSFENILIARATVKDSMELTALVNSAYRGEESERGWTTEAHLLGGQRTDNDKILELLNASTTHILKASTGDHGSGILGCVLLERQGDSCYLGMLTVNPRLQNSGIGKRLLFASEAYAKETLHCASIHMNVISVRTELIDWYKRHGYKETGETKPFPAGDKRFGILKVERLEFTVLKKNLF